MNNGAGNRQRRPHICNNLSEIKKMTSNEATVRGCTALIDDHIGNIHKYARPQDVPVGWTGRK